MCNTNTLAERIICLASDHERNCVYSLSENNWIPVWKTKPNKSLRETHTLSNLQNQAQDKARGAPALVQGFRLLSLHVISQRESKPGIRLVALSQDGVKLYFSTLSMGYVGYGYGPPQYGSYDSGQLQLVHVRLPPLNLLHPDEQFGPQRPNAYGVAAQQLPNSTVCVVRELTTMLYVNGLLIASPQSDVDGKGFILGVSPDLSKIRREMSFSVGDGRVLPCILRVWLASVEGEDCAIQVSRHVYWSSAWHVLTHYLEVRLNMSRTSTTLLSCLFSRIYTHSKMLDSNPRLFSSGPSCNDVTRAGQLTHGVGRLSRLSIRLFQ